MKKKSSKTTPSATMKLTAAETTAISCALDFMMHYNQYPYDSAKFDFEDADSAAWNADTGELVYKRREMRAITAAIDFSLHCLANDPQAVDQVAELFPEIIPVLQESVPVLEALPARLAAFNAKQAHRK